MLPVEQLGVSPFTASQRYARRYAPFRANARLQVSEQSAGQNALTGNLTPTELRPPLRFSTDELGYRRNPEIPRGAAPQVLMLGGDSFIYGANLSDSETLPAALTRASGLAVYNGGRSHTQRMTLKDLDWLLEQLPGRPTTAVMVHLEQHNPTPEDLSRRSPITENLSYVHSLVTNWWLASPLSNATRRLFREFADDRILPNTYRDAIAEYTLPDGRPMLFRGSETMPSAPGVLSRRTPKKLRDTAEYLLAWRDKLAARGLTTYVLLMPTRHTLYGPWLEEGESRSRVLQAGENLSLLAEELRANGVPTIDGLTVFRETAEQDLRTGDLPFYREDNHWTAEGVERMAAVLADTLASAVPAATTISRLAGDSSSAR